MLLLKIKFIMFRYIIYIMRVLVLYIGVLVGVVCLGYVSNSLVVVGIVV